MTPVGTHMQARRKYIIFTVFFFIDSFVVESTGIGPEVFAYMSADGNYTGGTATQANIDYYNIHGNYPYESYTYYYLRPEILESNFYAWRVTGDVKYLDRAASAIKSFQTYLKAPAGYAGIQDVNNPSAGQIDDTESFWYAEVLKYLCGFIP
jgi:mannosyl-oligosaccharide alpha-1,2-mannosidase